MAEVDQGGGEQQAAYEREDGERVGLGLICCNSESWVEMGEWGEGEEKEEKQVEEKLGLTDEGCSLAQALADREAQLFSHHLHQKQRRREESEKGKQAMTSSQLPSQHKSDSSFPAYALTEVLEPEPPDQSGVRSPKVRYCFHLGV